MTIVCLASACGGEPRATESPKRSVAQSLATTGATTASARATSPTRAPLLPIAVGDASAPLASMHEAKVAVSLDGKMLLGVYANRVYAFRDGLVAIPLDGSPPITVAAPAWTTTPRMSGSLVTALSDSKPPQVLALDLASGRSFTLPAEKDTIERHYYACQGVGYSIVSQPLVSEYSGRHIARVVDPTGRILFSRELEHHDELLCAQEHIVLRPGGWGPVTVHGLDLSGTETWKTDVELPGATLGIIQFEDVIAFFDSKAAGVVAIDTKTGAITRARVSDGYDAKADRFMVGHDGRSALVQVGFMSKGARTTFLELVDLRSGAKSWSVPVDEIERASLTADAVVLTESHGRRYNEAGPYRLVVLDRSTGAEAWSISKSQIATASADVWTDAAHRLVGIAVLDLFGPRFVIVRGAS